MYNNSLEDIFFKEFTSPSRIPSRNSHLNGLDSDGRRKNEPGGKATAKKGSAKIYIKKVYEKENRWLQGNVSL